ncbi:hypothetical protein H0O00_02140 [Candidatus Micrarchaeota archaeon]|nr:hypothetical protein [Candidatus Micrarchaeota archaeon]
MAGASVARREIVVPKAPVLAMANRFGKYKPETEKAVRKVDVKEDETLKKMKTAWKACSYTHNSTMDYARMFKILKKILKKVKYTAKDVENFSIAIAEFQEETDFGGKAGFFLSALMNKCKDRQFAIHTNHLAGFIHYLGYKNTKNITVDGNAGVNVGWRMKCGTITVNGNARSHVGEGMEDGSIIVEGDAGRSNGWDMKGGEIHFNGDYNGIGFNVDGKIFHKGKLIIGR